MKRLLFLLLPLALAAQTPENEGVLPAVSADGYALLPFEQFAPDLLPALGEDGAPKTEWYRAEIVYIETPDAPPQGAAAVSVPQIDRKTLDGLHIHRFAPILGQRYVYANFIWVETNPLGKRLQAPIPFGSVFYFVVEREKGGFADIQLYCYRTENLRWADATTLGLDKEGELAHNEDFVPRPHLALVMQKVRVKLGNWTLFLASKRTEKAEASGGIRQDKDIYGYVALRLRPAAAFKPAEEN